jgi:hypothetical protein
MKLTSDRAHSNAGEKEVESLVSHCADAMAVVEKRPGIILSPRIRHDPQPPGNHLSMTPDTH